MRRADLLVLLFAAVLLAGCSLRGKGEAQDVFDAYVRAAQDQDRDAIRDLTMKDDQTEQLSNGAL